MLGPPRSGPLRQLPLRMYARLHGRRLLTAELSRLALVFRARFMLRRHMCMRRGLVGPHVRDLALSRHAQLLWPRRVLKRGAGMCVRARLAWARLQPSGVPARVCGAWRVPQRHVQVQCGLLWSRVHDWHVSQRVLQPWPMYQLCVRVRSGVARARLLAAHLPAQLQQQRLLLQWDLPLPARLLGPKLCAALLPARLQWGGHLRAWRVRLPCAAAAARLRDGGLP